MKISKSISQLKLAMTSDKDFALESLKGNYLVLFFYPKDSTPGCTQEAHDFSQRIKKFEKLGVKVFGVSRDSIKSHENFKEKQKYHLQLISDGEQKYCEAFDVIKEKNMYGKKVKGIERSTFIINPEGHVAKEWRKVKVEGHAEEVLQWCKENI